MASTEPIEDAIEPSPLTSLLTTFTTAAERSFAAAEDAERAEMAAAVVAERAVESYFQAAVKVGMAECAKLIEIARAAENMTESVTSSVAHSSTEYLNAKVKTTTDPCVALKAAESALYTKERSDTVATFIKRKSLSVVPSVPSKRPSLATASSRSFNNATENDQSKP